jgi:hypothetical protein
MKTCPNCKNYNEYYRGDVLIMNCKHSDICQHPDYPKFEDKNIDTDYSDFNSKVESYRKIKQDEFINECILDIDLPNLNKESEAKTHGIAYNQGFIDALNFCYNNLPIINWQEDLRGLTWDGYLGKIHIFTIKKDSNSFYLREDKSHSKTLDDAKTKAFNLLRN